MRDLCNQASLKRSRAKAAAANEKRTGPEGMEVPGEAALVSEPEEEVLLVPPPSVPCLVILTVRMLTFPSVAIWGEG